MPQPAIAHSFHFSRVPGANRTDPSTPSPAAENRIPAPSNARFIKTGASRPVATFPASKFRTVITLTPAARARSAGVQFKRVRALRHCTGLMSPILAYKFRKNATCDGALRHLFPRRVRSCRRSRCRVSLAKSINISEMLMSVSGLSAAVLACRQRITP